MLWPATACFVHEQKGKEGVREQYEQTDEFHDRWRLKARDMIGRSAWRRQKLAKRVGGVACLIDRGCLCWVLLAFQRLAAFSRQSGDCGCVRHAIVLHVLLVPRHQYPTVISAVYDSPSSGYSAHLW